MNKSQSKLPIVNPGAAKGRSYYGGAFGKGDFVLPTISPKDDRETESSSIAKRLENRSKASLATFDFTYSRTSSKLLETNVSASRTESPLKDFFTVRDTPSRLRNSHTGQSRKTVKTLVDEGITRRTRLVRAPKIESYLDYLGATLNESVTSFASKMREKVIAQKEAISPPKDEPSVHDRFGFEEVIPAGLKSPVIDKPEPRRSYSKTPTTQASSTPNLQQRLNIIMSPESPESSKEDVLRRTLSKSRSKKMFWPNEGKDDEKIANDLAEEVVSNYSLYMTYAVKNKEVHAQMQHFMAEEGVLGVFNGKEYKQYPLKERIVKDMTESLDAEPTLKVQKTREIPSMVSPIRRRLLTKKTQSMVKLIQAKYITYVNVNNEILERNAKFKIEGLEAMEEELIQAHDDFVKKKKELLKSVSKTNPQKYHELKDQCKSVENALWSCEAYVLEEDYDSDTPDTENVMINKGLEVVMNKWKKNLIDKQC